MAKKEMTRKEKGLAKLAKWKRIHMKDPVYRAVLAKKQRERQAALKEDAEFGRIARIILQYLGSMMFKVGKPREAAEIRYEHPDAGEILAALKRPFSPQQATEYMELLKIKDEIENKKNGGSKGRKKRAR